MVISVEAGYKKQFADLLKKAGIVITKKEQERMELVHLNLGNFEKIGVGIIVYANTPRYCGKELLLLPRQTVPQHRHPPIGGRPGKQETFRCRWGKIYLNVPGKKTPQSHAILDNKYKKYFTVWHEIVLLPGDQYTLKPNTWHWFQAGDEGGIVSEFSSQSFDKFDIFKDPRIVR